jgi:glycosyltransferase involved in cell wall biosynthesis
MGKCRVAIVIPALNESATITGIIEVTRRYGVVIVIDDGSSDGTAELAEASGAIIVTHEKNQGYDVAINSGFKKAAELGAQIIITIDADGQHDPSLIQKFIDVIDAGADIVIGIRNYRQRFAEHLFAWYTNLRFEIKDPLCGMKAYRTHLYTSLGHFDSYGSVGTELTIFAAKKGYRIGQIQFSVRERRGKSRFGQIISANYKIIRALMQSLLLVR